MALGTQYWKSMILDEKKWIVIERVGLLTLLFTNKTTSMKDLVL